jgi:hypothetical protein
LLVSHGCDVELIDGCWWEECRGEQDVREEVVVKVVVEWEKKNVEEKIGLAR